MAIFESGDTRIYYEVHGEGFPVLLLAPGGMRSRVQAWDNAPWNPIEHLARSYRVIAMDQRNAGRSMAPVGRVDGWHTYTADQLALLDHLEIDRCHVLGMCIGGPFILGLLAVAQARIVSAVVLQTIGLDGNRARFFELFDGWAAEQRPQHPEADAQDWAALRNAMYGGDDPLFRVPSTFLRTCSTPILAMMGNDQYHPSSASRLLAAQAPNATLVEAWKEPEHQDSARGAVARFFAAHTPHAQHG